jgi:hypothetical protein
MRLPRTGQSETLAFALAHLDLVWPTDGSRVVWLDEGRSEVLKDHDTLARLGLGARIAGDGPRPDLMVLTRDPSTGRELLVVAEACASQGAVTQTRERQLRRFLEGLREDVQVQLVTLVLREEHVDAWRHDLAPASWVWLGDRLAGAEPTLVPSAALREAGR